MISVCLEIFTRADSKSADILNRCAGHLPVVTLADLPDPKAHLKHIVVEEEEVC